MSDVISGLTKTWTFGDKLHVTGTSGGCDPPDHSDEYETVERLGESGARVRTGLP